MTTQEIIDKLRFDEIAEPAMGWPLAYDVVFKGKKIAFQKFQNPIYASFYLLKIL